MYDGHIYDMIEMGIAEYEGLGAFEGSKKALASPPCFVFVGEEWENSPDHKLLRNMLLGAQWMDPARACKRGGEAALGARDGHPLELEGGVAHTQAAEASGLGALGSGADDFSSGKIVHSADCARVTRADIFGCRDMTGVSLQGLDHVILVGVVGATIHLRCYFMSFLSSDSRIPKVELAPMGPNLDLTLRRIKHATSSTEKDAMRIPAQCVVHRMAIEGAAAFSAAPEIIEHAIYTPPSLRRLKPKKVKNVSHDAFGETIGRIHMESQDFSKLELKKTKAARGGAGKRSADAAVSAAAAANAALAPAEIAGVSTADTSAGAGRPVKRARYALADSE